MDLKTLTNMFPSHNLVMGEQFAQENISGLKVRSILDWSNTIFVNCDFSEAELHLLMITGTIFFKCDFSGAKLKACDIDGCEFISCNLTCADIISSSVSDTTFTDCIIGGMIGPNNLNGLSFYFPRYSRSLPLTSHVPYYLVSTMTDCLYIFKTEKNWRIHGGKTLVVVDHDKIDHAEEPFKTALKAVTEMDSIYFGNIAARTANKSMYT